MPFAASLLERQVQGNLKVSVKHMRPHHQATLFV
jgi:hypothetical protein